MIQFLEGIGALALFAAALWSPFGRKVILTVGLLIGLLAAWMIHTS